jgi:hypothetical protein
MQEGESIRANLSPRKKAEWLRNAMERMEDLPPELRKSIREGCSCCLGGKRGQLSKAIGRQYSTLSERVAAANRTPFVFGHTVTQTEDDTFEVQFQPDGWEMYRCPCLPHAEPRPFPVTYCQCCGGHVKHHLQQAIGLKLDCSVVHTALTSAGKQPCVFSLRKV